MIHSEETLDHEGDAWETHINFGTFVASLATSALLYLGEQNPEDGTSTVDLPLAKQSIEIIGMIREKTRGNLTDDEQSLVDELLYDLRLRFMQMSQQRSS